jgi:hypothetical protein
MNRLSKTCLPPPVGLWPRAVKDTRAPSPPRKPENENHIPVSNQKLFFLSFALLGVLDELGGS